MAGIRHTTPYSPDSELRARRQRSRRVLEGLRERYPRADCALEHDSAFQLLVATILSAQSTDVMVNRVTPELFAAYPDAPSLAAAELEELETIVRRTGFYRQKAKNIRGAAERLTREHGGEVPASLEALTALPGVARKTANVVLGTWFGKNEGVVVDTHVGRVSERLDLTWSSRDSKDAVRIERDLMEVVPRDDWTYFSHAIIWHGRDTCRARNPSCDTCILAAHCPSAGRV